MQMKGIDVSRYQGDIDFEQVKKSGIDFVIIKAGEWDKVSPTFESQYAAAKAAGMHIGAYWFCDGETIADIKMEAKSCIETIKGKQFDFPIYMDMENPSQYDLGKKFCSEAVRTFCGELEKAGYFTGLYSSTSWLDSIFEKDVLERYTIWVADWRGYCGYKGKYAMWQYGAGYVPGINGKTDLNIIDIGYNTDYPGSVVADGVDLDYAYEDFPSIITSKGFNNYAKPDENAWENDPCREVANTLDIRGVTPILSGDKWFLIDKSCEFTLETLPYAKANIYLVGGGEDGAEWFRNTSVPVEMFDIGRKSRGGCVLKKEIYITGSPKCRAFVAEANDPVGTSIIIGSDIYKCTDEGYIWRKATMSGNSKFVYESNFNAESGANGVSTPYGYVGSSGGGGGAYNIIGNQLINIYAGKGGAGAGNGGNTKQNGTDATNYGCGGGAAGFGGYPSDGDTVETHAGHGMGGCIIFEILDGGACDSSPNKPIDSNSNCGCGCSCECPHHEFDTAEPAERTTSSTKETYSTLTYEGGEPVETENTTTTSSDSGSIEYKSATGKTSSGYGNSGSGNNSQTGCGCTNGISVKSGSCSCSHGGSVGNSRCISYDVQRWGENWVLFDESGDYSLTMDEDVNFTVYLVGGGEDGEDGIYYNRTAYGGNGGKGGLVNVIRDIKVPKGQADIIVVIGGRGDFGGTSVIINNNSYDCSGTGGEVNEGGFQGLSGRYGFRNAGNGTNGIETPFGYVGSSGGGGAAYCNGTMSGYGKGGLYAGNGGKIVNGKSTAGDKATGYGCGGGGGAASSTSWCKGGRGKRGCVIITWNT